MVILLAILFLIAFSICLYKISRRPDRTTQLITALLLRKNRIYEEKELNRWLERYKHNKNDPHLKKIISYIKERIEIFEREVK